MKTNKVLIIAEAGVNHNGSFDLAKKLVDAAIYAGADIVKFQTGIPELILTDNAPKAIYQKRETGKKDSQLEMITKITLPFNDYVLLQKYCNKVGIKFLSTPFDHKSIDFLKDLNIDIFKIPSGEITNLSYLKHIAKIGKKVILSTGMSTISEIDTALSVLKESLNDDQISILHCTTEYPAPFEEVNLRVINTLKQTFGLTVGYSDHTKGIEASIAAVTLGARIIEKHFTLDSNMVGPDHKASLEPDELKKMIDSIRNIELALGDGIKRVTNSESKNIVVVRKSIHIKNDLKSGNVLLENDLIMKVNSEGDEQEVLKFDSLTIRSFKGIAPSANGKIIITRHGVHDADIYSLEL